MKKLLGILAATGLVATTGATVVSCGDKKADESATKTDLSKLATKELGDIKGTGDLPSVANLVSAINAKNKDYGLTANDVELDGTATTAKAKLKAKSASTKFTGSVEVSYTYTKDETAVEKHALSEISGDDLKLSPTDNEEASAKTAAIAKIKEKLSVDVVETTDVTFSGFEAATNQKAGSIKVTAVETSKLVSGEVTFTLNYKAQETSKKALSALVGEDAKLSPTDNEDASAKTAAIAKIKEKLSVDVVETTDVTFSGFEAATNQKAGSIKVTAVETSKLVSGEVTFTLNFVG